MRSAGGAGIWIDKDSGQVKAEYDSITCNHCQSVVFIKPGTGLTVYMILDRMTGSWKEEMGAFCRVCMKSICIRCCERGICIPFEQKIEQSEARDRFARQIKGDYK